MTATAPLKADLSWTPTLDTMRKLGSAVTLEAAALEAARPRITPAEDFAGRTGYTADFLGEFAVPLPKPGDSRAADVLRTSRTDDALPYTHFSVVMSISRRMAMFTAVNISGADAVKITRSRDVWSFDGRIPTEAQLGDDLYADNDLDRGHLVRREDPNWGNDETADVANDDTFHFTNCSPQMHRMNSITWLGLETYILKNAKAWKERVTVFTGPVFGENDLTYRGVEIPLAYWKVVAFLSDDGKPSATAYMVDQEHELSSLEAAYGRYKTYQRSVRYVEKVSGLSFGRLAKYDGFSNHEAAGGLEAAGKRYERELRSLADIVV